LSVESLRSNRIQGDGWALAGDAAGFADPITGEGICYALRSGELLAQALISGRPGSYAAACWRDFVHEFLAAAQLFDTVYTGRFLGSDLITRTVQGIASSNILGALANRFMAGSQGYKSLASNLEQKMPGILFQVLSTWLGFPGLAVGLEHQAERMPAVPLDMRRGEDTLRHSPVHPIEIERPARDIDGHRGSAGAIALGTRQMSAR
jgi:hypothetical protein